MVNIWYDVQNGSGYTLISMSCQTFSFYPASSDLVYLCHNLWCHNSRKKLFLGICFCDFDISFVFTQKACFICAQSCNVTTFFLLSLKNRANFFMKDPGMYLIHEHNNGGNQSHKSGTNFTLYNVAMNGFPLSSRILFELLLSLLQNAHLQLRYIYLFSPTIPLQNSKSLMSCDKSYLSLKYNWSVAICL